MAIQFNNFILELNYFNLKYKRLDSNIESKSSNNHAPTHAPHMHRHMQGPACPSTKTQIRPHLTCRQTLRLNDTASGFCKFRTKNILSNFFAFLVGGISVLFRTVLSVYVFVQNFSFFLTPPCNNSLKEHLWALIFFAWFTRFCVEQVRILILL